MGGIAEDPIDSTGIEAKLAEPALNIGHVIALQHGDTPIEESVTEAKTCLYQARPGLPTANTVNTKPALGLKIPYCKDSSRTVIAVLVGVGLKIEPS
jgi:hypothetical protein